VSAEQSVVDQANYQVDFNREYFTKFFPPVCVADGEVPSIQFQCQRDRFLEAFILDGVS
jgi:hypothetical protein